MLIREKTSEYAYPVFALLRRWEDIYFFVLDYNEFYIPCKSSDVTIIDPRFSRYWTYLRHETPGPASTLVEITSIPPLASDPALWEHLFDNTFPTIEFHWRYYDLLSLEFAPPFYPEPRILKDGWVMCEDCCDAWQPGNTHEYIVCPKCLLAYRNPFPISEEKELARLIPPEMKALGYRPFDSGTEGYWPVKLSHGSDRRVPRPIPKVWG